MTNGHHVNDEPKGVPMSRVHQPVAEVCLYGTRQTGAGYLVSIYAEGGRIVRLGTGEPKADRSFTEALWIACGLIQTAGFDGFVHVYEPTGQKFAEVHTFRVPAYGNLTWIDGGTAYVIPASAILEAAAL
jgi:hypothetical protein